MVDIGRSCLAAATGGIGYAGRTTDRNNPKRDDPREALHGQITPCVVMAEIPAEVAAAAPAKDEVANPLDNNTLETELATVSEPSFSYIDDDSNKSFSVVNKRRRSRRVPNTTITKPERPDNIILYESVSKSNLATEILSEEDQWLCKVCGFKNFVFPTVCAMCLCYKDVESSNLFVYTLNGMKEKVLTYENLPRVKKMASKAKKVREIEAKRMEAERKLLEQKISGDFAVNRESHIFNFNNKDIIAKRKHLLGIKSSRSRSRKRSSRAASNKNSIGVKITRDMCVRDDVVLVMHQKLKK